MELSNFTLTLIFIFLPGLLAWLISERLTTHPKRKVHELFIYALVLGCMSHLVYMVIYKTISTKVDIPADLWLDLMTKKEFNVQGLVVLYTALIGILIGFVVAFAANHSWLHRFAWKLRITREFADFDVWSYLMNSDTIQWIVVRDQGKNLMYQGAISAFSKEEDPRELVLRNVTVFKNDTAEKLYDANLMYMSFEKKAVTFETYE